MIRAIIIDDEVKARSALKQEVNFNCQDVTIIGEADSVKSGVILINDSKPDLIFLDIQLSDGVGFNILEQIKPHNLKVIFTTAYSEHAIKAFRFNAIDYLLKPIDGDELRQAVDKIVNTQTNIFEQKLNAFLQNKTANNTKKKIALHTSEGIKLIELQAIIRCNSDTNYTYFHFENNTKMLISKTMKTYEDLLIPYGFIKIHKSHIINLDHLLSYQNNDGGYVIMTNGDKLPVAQRRKTHLLQTLEEFNS
jgi:two-component system LytT family response regulator